jgi:hypothetical protein
MRSEDTHPSSAKLKNCGATPPLPNTSLIAWCLVVIIIIIIIIIICVNEITNLFPSLH